MAPLFLWFCGAASAAPSMENLGRGVVAVRQSDGRVFVSWRLLATDPVEMAFNVYRSTAGAPPLKLNSDPIGQVTWMQDTEAGRTQDVAYFVHPIVGGREQERSAPFLNGVKAGSFARPYFELPLKLPAGSTPSDASAGDLDGDGEYELVLKAEQRPRDTAATGLAGETSLQGYRLDGTLLWTINLGKNIREGAHYTQFMVYDLDGDGLAEIACKTADGTSDGKGRVIGDPNADWRDTNPSSRTFGRVLKGPEYLTIFDGKTGAALATTNYIPRRDPLDGWGGIGGNGGNDSVGNRADRMLACVAYLDGELPSVVMCRGYYGRSVLAAWDWRGGKLSLRWVFDTASPGTGKDGKPHHAYAGMGCQRGGRRWRRQTGDCVSLDGCG
jgi:rhamnogalacturonan endolyase